MQLEGKFATNAVVLLEVVNKQIMNALQLQSKIAMNVKKKEQYVQNVQVHLYYKLVKQLVH